MSFLTRRGALLLVWCCFIFEVSKGVERGKIEMEENGEYGFHCRYVPFSSSFSSGSPVRVFASVNHGNKSSLVHDSVFLWVEDVTTSRFKACFVQGGQDYGGNATIDWFAFQGSQAGVYHGEASFSLFTTGTKCNQVTFPQAFSLVPKVHVTVTHGTLNQKKDAMSVWIESISTSQFEVCLQESRKFDGPHRNLAVNWMAYEYDYPSSWQAKLSSEVMFINYEVRAEENNYAICKNVHYPSPYYSPPVVLATACNGDGGNANTMCPMKKALSVWLEEVTNSHFRVCIKDDADYNGQRNNITVNYLTFGDIDPCTNKSCKYHGHCVASSPHHFTCVCNSSCPSYEEQVCASNGRTFNNLCLLKKEICETHANYTNYHPGSCTGFPYQKGRQKFKNIPTWAEDQCETIRFEQFVFYPHRKIYVQLTVNHVNYSDATFVHEATTPWIENVNTTQFTACVTRAGRNDYPADSFATVDWIAYQGAPPGGVTGEEKFSRWWTGTTCQMVTLPSGEYSDPPTVFVTAEHYRSGLKHDAASVWLEDVSASSFKICLRELQNFAGVHDDVSVHWLAFQHRPKPLLKEHGDVTFTDIRLPSKDHNFAFCEDTSFIRSYRKPPTIMLTAKHSTSVGNVAAECNGIASWIEFITNSSFRICVKELFVQGFDPLTVSYAVLTDICQDDWSYYNGYCYQKVSSCDSWSNSQRVCASTGGNLPSIHSQEENVFVQSLHGSRHSWLGLSDISAEGAFVWSDRTPLDFHHWAKGQPNNLHNQDCVHTLGFLHKFEWNDVNCTDCHGSTCKKDYDECRDFPDYCPTDATCVNNYGSYSCRCPAGYRLDGDECADVDECQSLLSSCHAQAQCVNVLGSYECRCSPGYAGDGHHTCEDVDECLSGSFSCDVQSQCVNVIGSYNCRCLPGYAENDVHICSDVDECQSGSYSCHAQGQCVNVVGSYDCRCLPGYAGDGQHACSDVDECQTGSYSCHAQAQCVNVHGSYACACLPGYAGDGQLTCSDVDECQTGSFSCHAQAQCVNLHGSYDCTCLPGYVGDGRYTCSDVDECQSGSYHCHPEARCVNVHGSYGCRCLPGYEGDGQHTCSDVDECQTGSFSCHAQAQCVNVAGSYDCTCLPGYAGNGHLSCSDVDECQSGSFSCPAQAQCVNVVGSYQCTCPAGYVSDGQNSCSDVDECQTGSSSCHAQAQCVNVHGSYECRCRSGYAGDTCSDVDECQTGSYVCHELAQCVNVIGSYDCTCLPGYIGDGEQSCSLESGQSSVTATGSCTNLLTVETSTTGLIYSNDISHGVYSNDMSCSWSLSANKNVELVFLRFVTEQCCDAVSVYDGPTSSSPLIGEYKGDVLPGSIVSTSNQLYVTFNSDGSVLKSGFQAAYSVQGQSFATASSSCANLLTVETYVSGIIYSNMYGVYNDGMNCSWSISSNSLLELVFKRYQTESSYDFTTVYDGGSSSSPMIGRYDGNSLPASVTSSSHELYVTFTSDGSVKRSGFLASYHISGQPFATASSTCANVLTVRSSSSGIIYSNQDGVHGHNMNCSWSIFSSTNLELVFFRFDTEGCCDYVYVYDGGSPSSRLIGRYHGTSLPAVITSSTNQLYVTFTSDGSVARSGFAASYHVVNTIRLVNGSTPLTGRVEVFAGGQWGTVCDDDWDINDANVVCRQLGFPPATQAFSSAHHGEGSGQIWIDNLNCLGNELHIDDCTHYGWGNHNCNHYEDASVECSSTIP